jgi:hypothetical protein
VEKYFLCLFYTLIITHKLVSDAQQQRAWKGHPQTRATLFTFADARKCPLSNSSWLDASRSEVTIATIPSYAELFKFFSIFRAHGNLKVKPTIIFKVLKYIFTEISRKSDSSVEFLL